MLFVVGSWILLLCFLLCLVSKARSWGKIIIIMSRNLSFIWLVLSIPNDLTLLWECPRCAVRYRSPIDRCMYAWVCRLIFSHAWDSRREFCWLVLSCYATDDRPVSTSFLWSQRKWEPVDRRGFYLLCVFSSWCLEPL